MEKRIDTQISIIKDNVMQMWNMTRVQVCNAKKALLDFDKSTAEDVRFKEQYCNKMDNKISLLCENFIALDNPVATDLRLVLAMLRINSNLERIADFAEDIARAVSLDLHRPFSEKAIQETCVQDIFEALEEMDNKVTEAFVNSDTKGLREMFVLDDKIDNINRASTNVLSDLIRKDIDNTESYIVFSSIIKRLERVGDRLTNIAEEIIFYLEAENIKHSKDKQ